MLSLSGQLGLGQKPNTNARRECTQAVNDVWQWIPYERFEQVDLRRDQTRRATDAYEEEQRRIPGRCRIQLRCVDVGDVICPGDGALAHKSEHHEQYGLEREQQRGARVVCRQRDELGAQGDERVHDCGDYEEADDDEAATEQVVEVAERDADHLGQRRQKVHQIRIDLFHVGHAQANAIVHEHQRYPNVEQQQRLDHHTPRHEKLLEHHKAVVDVVDVVGGVVARVVVVFAAAFDVYDERWQMVRLVQVARFHAV